MIYEWIELEVLGCGCDTIALHHDYSDTGAVSGSAMITVSLYWFIVELVQA